LQFLYADFGAELVQQFAVSVGLVQFLNAEFGAELVQFLVEQFAISCSFYIQILVQFWCSSLQSL